MSEGEPIARNSPTPVRPLVGEEISLRTQQHLLVLILISHFLIKISLVSVIIFDSKFSFDYDGISRKHNIDV